MNVLEKAAKDAHTQKLAALATGTGQRYSRYPVHEQEFWISLEKAAKNPKTAQSVLDHIVEIEEEPCIENPRVFRVVQATKQYAKLALLKS